ncbi:RagB/SusD family nutrient uptake outer membrane protein [Alistipes shahii]|uniref:RagB/SusD family nutrient uptake outer membrane protein n=1 Tax=Alistipes shahii TaxID=328814 RepID=UPI002431C971|nr:RagB/SusD family nutrient uptake outer membrane protein [Alistipes shahii]MCI7594328.1 RagB/SusD family nutrient uptake outer membrane protein [Alistipes shahii]
MKNILITLSFLLLLTSCEYLDVVPEGKATQDDIWKTTQQAEKYRYYMRTYMPNLIGYDWSPDQFAGDDMITGGVGTTYWFSSKSLIYGEENANVTYFGRWAPYSTSGGTNYDIYRGIRYAFYLLDNVYKVPAISPENAARYAGEAWYLIGYYHQLLLEYYGPIILVKRYIPNDAPDSEIFAPRSPYDECVKYIAECYDKAAELLPETVIDTELGLPTRMSALSYKARLLLYAASPLVNGNSDYVGFDNHDGTPLMNTTYDPEKWKKAMEAAAEAISVAEKFNSELGRQNFMLYTSADSSLPNDERGRRNYRDAFTKEHWNGLEFIEAKGDRGGCQTLQQLMGPRPIANNMSLGWKTTLVPTMEAVEMYYTKNGLPWEDDPETKDIDPYAYNAEAGTVNLHLYKEPRFYASVGYDRGTYEIDGKEITLYLRGGELHGSTLKETDEYQSCTGYLCQKWIPKASTYSIPSNSFSFYYYAYPYLRLPELYLSYAEADFEYNGSLSTQSLEYINLVRKRCGLPTFQASWALAGGIPTGQKLRKVLHQERSIEFLFEGRRFHDLRRWKEAPEVMNKQPRSWNRDGKTAEEFYQVIEANQGGRVRIFESPKSYWMAVPMSEINKNPNLVQNPGY